MPVSHHHHIKRQIKFLYHHLNNSNNLACPFFTFQILSKEERQEKVGGSYSQVALLLSGAQECGTVVGIGRGLQVLVGSQ